LIGKVPMDGTYQKSRCFRHSKTPQLWPWIVSICVHIAILAAFATIKIATKKTSFAALPIPKAQISQIKKIANSASILPKPKVKKNFYKSALKPTFKPTMSNNAAVLKKPTTNLEELARESLSNQSLLPQAGALLAGKVELFNIATDQRKICYLIDRSGSMQGVFHKVIERVKKSISDLQPDHYFYIIFFGADQLLESGSGSMTRATEYAKTEALNFLASIKPAGKTNTLAAFKRAMQLRDSDGQKPAVIYFLTDGFELSNKSALHFADEVEILRKKLAPETKINTIGFWTEPKDCELLKTIAGNSGGSFVRIDEQFN